MPNLAQDLRTTQGEVVQFPKKEQRTMSTKQDGFTGLPNFICDEGYLSALSGEAIKCLILLNRHITGFHLGEKALAESLIMKITGINDKRTIRKKMDELAKFQLVKISKCKGKTTKYSTTFESRLAVKLVASDVPSTLNVATCHATSLVASDVPSTSDMACHPIKEIDLKENSKINTQEPAPENSVDEILNLWTPNLNSLNAWLQRAGEMAMTQELVNQVLLEVNAYYELKLKTGQVTDSQMYANFVKWMKRKFTNKSNSYPKKQTQPVVSTRNVNDAWGQEQQYAPAVDDIDLGDFV